MSDWPAIAAALPMLLGALATVTLAAASYHLLELPLRRGYARRRMRAQME